MTASSVSRKVAAIEKAKKVERRNAIIQRQKPKDDIVKHIETEVRGVSAETSGGDSIIDSGKIKATPKPKSKVKKASGAKKGGSSKKVLSNSKTAKI